MKQHTVIKNNEKTMKRMDMLQKIIIKGYRRVCRVYHSLWENKVNLKIKGICIKILTFSNSISKVQGVPGPSYATN